MSVAIHLLQTVCRPRQSSCAASDRVGRRPDESSSGLVSEAQGRRAATPDQDGASRRFEHRTRQRSSRSDPPRLKNARSRSGSHRIDRFVRRQQDPLATSSEQRARCVRSSRTACAPPRSCGATDSRRPPFPIEYIQQREVLAVVVRFRRQCLRRNTSLSSSRGSATARGVRCGGSSNGGSNGC